MLRRVSIDDAEALARAINESIEHLRPWMPWAAGDVTVESQRAWLSGTPSTWDEGGEYHFAILLADGTMVGCCGLARRAGPHALDIGYWVHAAHTRRGVATTAARALTDAGFELEGIERIEIHCDEGNQASAAVAARLGYRLHRTVEVAPVAASETGTRAVWVMDRAGWSRQ